MPRDVARFVERRASCEHFIGEEPYDKKRADFLVAAVQEYCYGTDAELAQLRQKYHTDAAVTAKLEQYDPDIEP